MSKCPSCGAEVDTPSVFDLAAWSAMACPNCKARLRMRRLRSPALTMLVILLVSCSLVRPLGYSARGALAGLAVVFSIGNVLFLFWEYTHPRLRLRKRPKPDPETALNLH